MSNYVFSSESASRPGSASRNPGAPDAAAVTRPWLVPSPPPDWAAATHGENPRQEPSCPKSCWAGSRRRLPPAGSPCPNPSPSVPSLPWHPRRGPPGGAAALPPAQRQKLRRPRPLGSPPGSPPAATFVAAARTMPEPVARAPRAAPTRRAPGTRAASGARRGAASGARSELAVGAALQLSTAPTPPPPPPGGPGARSAPRRRRRRPGTKRGQAAGPAPPSAGLGQSRSGARVLTRCGAAGARAGRTRGGAWTRPLRPGCGGQPGPPRTASLARRQPLGTGAAPTPPPSARRRRAAGAGGPAPAPLPSLSTAPARGRGAAAPLARPAPPRRETMRSCRALRPARHPQPRSVGINSQRGTRGSLSGCGVCSTGSRVKITVLCSALWRDALCVLSASPAALRWTLGVSPAGVGCPRGRSPPAFQHSLYRTISWVGTREDH